MISRFCICACFAVSYCSAKGWEVWTNKVHFISFPISVFLLDCISYFCTSVFLLHCISLYFFAAQCSWRRGSKSLVQLLMLDKWSSPLGPLRTYTLIYFWSPPFISCDNSLKFSIYSNGKMRSPSVRPTEDLYSHLGNNLKKSKKMCPSLTPKSKKERPQESFQLIYTSNLSNINSRSL